MDQLIVPVLNRSAILRDTVRECVRLTLASRVPNLEFDDSVLQSAF